MGESIIHFLLEQTCANIACVDEQGKPWCFSCFYAFSTEDGLLFFKSSPGSHHAMLMKNNRNIAGTVLPDKLNKLLIKGLQFSGNILSADHPLAIKSNLSYLKKFPLSITIPGEIWTVLLDSVKLTDSSKVFAKKINWNRVEPAKV